ncbi:efflux RND transporter permease subunit [Rhizobium sp. SG570]|uniref:efflux RND transporter permease subunit n=1 Tax=Rhizobium sp. SG570 TaxID=2587113 RepID=UPI001445BFB6|nr:efflux RND transporter permease subunit [Rhizobium sp. SG570]
MFFIQAAQHEGQGPWLLSPRSFPFLDALVATMPRRPTNDIYFQIGTLTLLGLAAKNAILIVEFAAVKRRECVTAARG